MNYDEAVIFTATELAETGSAEFQFDPLTDSPQQVILDVCWHAKVPHVGVSVHYDIGEVIFFRVTLRDRLLRWLTSRLN